ncbi:TlpA family protein disulfide reductase [Numidum massiliense]|uniref:TlpA family protein disulfide reductase n=1 Tax=Numidum massiliense TaxID=1522315 RepID=UPI0006D54180|nr:TlpA disulfide reductase family protein [Numidum massiliense]
MRWGNILIGLALAALAIGAIVMNLPSDDNKKKTAEENKQEATATNGGAQEDKNAPQAQTPEEKGDGKEDKSEKGADKQGKPKRDVKPQKGFVAPEFALAKMGGGETVSLSANNGKPTLVNFWASWCGPCRIEMPDMQEAYEKYGDKLNFLMVNMTFTEKSDSDAPNYIKEEGYTFPVLMDENGDVAEQYAVLAVPSTFMIDENGVVVERVQGLVPAETLQALIEQLVD